MGGSIQNERNGQMHFTSAIPQVDEMAIIINNVFSDVYVESYKISHIKYSQWNGLNQTKFYTVFTFHRLSVFPSSFAMFHILSMLELLMSKFFVVANVCSVWKLSLKATKNDRTHKDRITLIKSFTHPSVLRKKL